MSNTTELPRTTMNGKPVYTVPSKTTINFKSGFGHKLLCDDMTFTTGQACAYSCSFCYVEAMQKKSEDRFKSQGVKYPPEGHAGVVIRNDNPIEIARQQIMSKPLEFRQKKLVIYSSPKVDVAANMELVKETVEMCKLIISETNWHIRLLSKSNLLPKIAAALDEWFQSVNWPSGTKSPKHRIIYGVSTGTLDNKLAQAFEEGCPLVSKRIESLHWLQDNGYRTFGMICPSLPQVVISQGYYDDWAAEMASKIRADRCEHVWAEVINVRGDSFTKTIKCLTDAGFLIVAERLRQVSEGPRAAEHWEEYSRMTFLAHKKHIDPAKLRFLQYTNKGNRDWWDQPGAVRLENAKPKKNTNAKVQPENS